MNYIAGMSKMPWALFTVMSISGESLWIAIYLALGAAFSASIGAIDEFVTNLTWFIGAAFIAMFLGYRLYKLANRPSRQNSLKSSKSDLEQP